MELEVVGRHALFFDDDASAAFVNSGDALVDWNSLKIDRYDVRHLLSAPLPPRRRLNPQITSQLPDFAFECELDRERYLDLPPPSVEPEGEEALKLADNDGYHAVAFSYGKSDESANQKNAEGELGSSGFHPPFAVPENLLQSLPSTEKVHQIIAKTATFVSKHGAQSEIVLRVKQGDNPTFGFLMPDHQLHPYFRFLVDHQELLQSDIDGKTQTEDQMAKTNQISTESGALSLLGSVYGSGEDEDSAVEGGQDVVNVALEKTVNTSSARDYKNLEKTKFSSNEAKKDKDDIITKHLPSSNKEKTPALKKNPSIRSSKSVTTSMKQKDDSGLISSSLEKLKEPLVLEPPSELKRLIDKIVEFIVKNGKQFEITLREQDSKQGRFPFLQPSNQYHPYYLKVLQRAEESKVGARNSFHVRDDVAGRNLDKKALVSEDNDASSLGYVGFDVPFESDRKEKFKMVISKSKKDVLDAPSEANQQEIGISLDATAAILQAATRGIRNPNLGIISSIGVNGGRSGHGHSKGVGRVSNLRSQGSSELSDIQISDQNRAHNSSVSVSQTAKRAAAEADSPEADLTREQKLKAERLRRAKMFVAKLKSGAGPSVAEPSVAEPSGSLSAEPTGSASLVAAAEVNLVDQAKEGSSVPGDSCTPQSENTERNHFGDEQSERKSRRKYRLRSERHDMDDENDDEEDAEDIHSRKKHQSHGSLPEGNDAREKDDKERSHKHARRKHRSHHSSSEEENTYEGQKGKSHKRSRKKHRSHHSSHDEDDGGKDHSFDERNYHKHSRKKRSSHHSSDEGDDRGDYEDEKYHKHLRKKHRSHRDRDSRKHRKESHRRSKHESSSDTEQGDRDGCKRRKEESLRRSKNKSSSDTEHVDRMRDVKHLQKEELEEGEISSKASDHSRGSVADGGSRETSMDNTITHPRAPSLPSQTTEVSDDLRAKIRAMLMATR